MFKRISDLFYKLFYRLCAGGFLVLVVLLFIQVFTRNVLKYTSSPIDEFTKFLFVWVMFLGISLAVYRDKHIGIEFFTDKLRGSAKKYMAMFNAVLTIIFFIILSIYGAAYTISTMSMISPILKWSMGIMYLCVPIGSAFSIIFSVYRLLELFSDNEKLEERQV